MSKIKSILHVTLSGHVDDSILRLLCAELDLEESGRLDDDYDELFGERQLRPEEQGDYSLDLYRDSDTEWYVMVSAEPPLPTTAEVMALRQQIFTAAGKAGLEAREIYLRHVD